MKLSIIFLAFAVCSCCSVKPKFPRITPNPVTFDAPPKSVINVPVTADFSEKLPEIDKLVQNQFPISGGQDDCGLSYSYHIEKTAPLTINFDPAASPNVTFSSQLSVGAGASYCAVCVSTFFFHGCIVPKIGASCGQGEPLRRVKVSFSTPVDIAPNYSLFVDTKIKDLYFIDPCRVTFLNIDISGIIANQARRRIPVGAVNSNVASISLKNQVQRSWDFLNTKLDIGSGLYLKIHPEYLTKEPITGTGQVLQTSIGLVASPEITNDPTVLTPVVLPDLRPSSGFNGFTIFSDIKLDYKYLSTRLTEALKNYEIKVAGKKMKIKQIVTYATQDQRLIIKANFRGDLCGHVYIIGKPIYNPATNEVQFTQLKYDAITNNFIVNVGLAAAWLLQPFILQQIETKAKVNIKPFIDQNITKVNSSLTKDYHNGFSTIGKISSVKIVPNNFQSLPQFFLIRMHAIGDFQLKVKL
jgi:Domain of unknown function (DUF4403)